MEWTRLVVLELAPGEVYAHECGDAEWIVLPLRGGCRVRCADAPGPGGAAGPDGAPGPRDRGSAPDPAPQTPEGLDSSRPGSAGAPGGSNRASAEGRHRPNPASPAFEARGFGGGAPAAAPQVFELRGRTGVFDAVSDFVYVPRDGRVEIEAAQGGRFALAGARCERRLPARYGAAESVPVELRGAGNCSRQVNNFGAAHAFPADRLIAVEVLTPGGNWSSYPPHKHDTPAPGEESRLEEIYYFEIAPHGDTPGVGYQRVTPSPAGKTDILAEVRSGDAVLIPDGWHGPSIAAPGHDMYYLNVMAGPPGEPREWLIRDHPDHAWIRGSWDGQDTDPRLPFPAAEEENR
ncbi:5-deoxy-glucuronate isomerase [Streptomyces sp. NBC_01351]|uniref:5-deoxy-glucuronate isomerase n=1 Tax=Streptomyces sp. NBC_01351 TaxID=2903833 RepID=UPI002E3052DB|nr:5-deoxy-glucuronate isomerase [Streptomyces sp. NBC_01351]